MAGVEINKTTIGALKGQDAHFNNERRKITDHSNKDIDKTKTHLNYYLGANSFDEMKKKGTQMIKEYDKEHPPKRVKKDRKTILQETIWCPKDLEEKQEEFFRRVFEEMEKEFPGCIVGGCVHLDEKHEYIDANTKEKKESLFHLQLFKVPYSSENGVNMKSFCTKAYLRKVNCICEDVARELGGRYHTGEGKHTSKEMKQLKLESEKALEELIKEKKIELKEKDEQIEEKNKQIEEQSKELKQLKQDYAMLSAKVLGKEKKNKYEELEEKAVKDYVTTHHEEFMFWLEEQDEYEELYEYMKGDELEDPFELYQ